MEWVSLPEAARRLGISEMTVRRRLRAGELEGEQESTPQGYRWLIRLPEGATPTSGPPEAQGAGPLVVDSSALISSLQEQLAWLRGRVEEAERASRSEREQKERLLEILAAEQEKNRVLTTPTEGPTPEPSQEASQGEQKGRRWWRRGKG